MDAPWSEADDDMALPAVGNAGGHRVELVHQAQLVTLGQPLWEVV